MSSFDPLSLRDTAMHNTLSTAVSAMDSFVWSEQLPLAHWAVPLGTAIVYIALCCLHNARLSRGYQVRQPRELYLTLSLGVPHSVSQCASLCLFLGVPLAATLCLFVWLTLRAVSFINLSYFTATSL